jgi:hypothetical protein
MATYRYLFADALTDQVIAELQLTGVTYGQELNTAGSFSGHILISDQRESIFDIDFATTPGRRALYVERDGTIVWGGLIWSRTYDSQTQTLGLTGREFESWLENRVVQSNTTPYGQLTYSGDTDVFDVIRSIYSYLVARYPPYSSLNIGISSNLLGRPVGISAGMTWLGSWFSGFNYSVGDAVSYGGQAWVANTANTNETPGTTSAWDALPDFQVLDSEFRPFLDVVQQLSRQAGQTGFDFNVDITYDVSGNIVKTLNLEPRRGDVVTIGSSQYSAVLDFPGNVVFYSWPEDGNSIVTEGFGVGNGSGDGGIWYGNDYLTTVANLDTLATSQLLDGYPLLQKVYSASNEHNPFIVGDLTEAFVNAKQFPVTVATIVWDQVAQPPIGYFKVGDEFRISIVDSRFPNGLDTVMRLTKYEVQAGEDGPERITGSFINPATMGF